ncbi:GyrI-like domain-containing protein [Paenibacillus tundrae]
MEQVNSVFELVHKEASVVVGTKWEGTFGEAGAGGIRVVQSEFKRRLGEIQHVLYPDELLGLSYHMTGTGFTHYVGVEVDPSATREIPEGMERIEVASSHYAKRNHRKGQNIEASYNELYVGIEASEYQLAGGALTHYEVYPMTQKTDESDPEFTIFIPVIHKS